MKEKGPQPDLVDSRLSISRDLRMYSRRIARGKREFLRCPLGGRELSGRGTLEAALSALWQSLVGAPFGLARPFDLVQQVAFIFVGPEDLNGAPTPFQSAD